MPYEQQFQGRFDEHCVPSTGITKPHLEFVRHRIRDMMIGHSSRDSSIELRMVIKTAVEDHDQGLHPGQPTSQLMALLAGDVKLQMCI
jgi:hypothetical protein